MIIHLEPDILEYEVKWSLGSITRSKTSGGNGIPFEIFQILKDDAVKMLYSICQQIKKIKNSAVATGLEKVGFHSKLQRKAMPKNAQITAKLHSFHTLKKKC